ncbi:hypothetical protein HDU77_009176 [Chytriomyces hyalinus]|nr:hypothetical protein HDU77_009176 [Chytriomyces hyalinus]
MNTIHNGYLDPGCNKMLIMDPDWFESFTEVNISISTAFGLERRVGVRTGRDGLSDAKTLEAETGREAGLGGVKGKTRVHLVRGFEALEAQGIGVILRRKLGEKEFRRPDVPADKVCFCYQGLACEEGAAVRVCGVRGQRNAEDRAGGGGRLVDMEREEEAVFPREPEAGLGAKTCQIAWAIACQVRDEDKEVVEEQLEGLEASRGVTPEVRARDEKLEGGQEGIGIRLSDGDRLDGTDGGLTSFMAHQTQVLSDFQAVGRVGWAWR